MTSALSRRANNATNSLHSLIYFAPEAEERFTALGLKPGRMCYFAGRAAPMGAVGAGVVTATFYNFSPSLVARCIPAAWELARPAEVVTARFDAAHAALNRLLGADMLTSPQMATMAELTRAAAGAARPEGRPLYAAHADLSWPDEPHLVFWHAATLLREHRGDGHIAALVMSGLTGLEALVTHTATGKGFQPRFARSSRGWSDAEWDAAVAGLTERGVLDETGALSQHGQRMRDHIEQNTDRLAAGPWEHLGEARTEQVIELGREMSRTAATAGAFPDIFGPGR